MTKGMSDLRIANIGEERPNMSSTYGRVAWVAAK